MSKTAREVIEQTFREIGIHEEFGAECLERWTDSIERDLDAAGFVIVPKEADEAMCVAGNSRAQALRDGEYLKLGTGQLDPHETVTSDELKYIYRAMIAAATPSEPVHR